MAGGTLNLITDVPGLMVGAAHDARLRSGVTVLLSGGPMRAAVDIRGGGPGTRDTETLNSGGVVGEIHAVVLSGGSAFGLDAATGVQSYLRERGVGFAVGPARVPIVPQAILFDLLNGGDKDWGRHPPYRELAYEACAGAARRFALGTAGAGYGATVAFAGAGGRMMGGLGSASASTEDGAVVGALAAVNAAGTATIAGGPHFWAAPFERNAEFGALGWPAPFPVDGLAPVLKGGAGENTTLGIVATDVALDRSELRRLAIMAQTGLVRALHPAHTPLDGDIVFAVSTARRALADPVWGLAGLGALAAATLARAIARGVYEAEGFGDAPEHAPSYTALFGSRKSG